MSNAPVQDNTSSSSIDIRVELDRFRQKLLDLSNTNRLLNYRKSKTRTVQIIDELPNKIFERLVVKEKPFSFLCKEDDAAGAAEAVAVTSSESAAPTDEVADHELPEHPDEAGTISRRHADDKLQTEMVEAKLERVLNRMRQDANAAIEETGVNYLYLAIGMLDWRDRDGSDRVFKAPLILVPVRLQRDFDVRTKKYRVAVVYSGEDVQQNLCLMKRLETDFALALPEYRPSEDGVLPTPEEYFAQVTVAIQSRPQWRVCREVLLGFFSFRKLLMYLDLDPERWQGEYSLEKHPLVRAIIEGGELPDEGASLFAKDYDIDNHETAQRIALVKDADSSQHSALCDIAEGKSLVIEGPPGTGKSQTITNAIADALNAGKSVLFVAEKLAALEVVRNNLEKAGLGDFCLELHSDAATSRKVIDELRRRLGASFPGPEGISMLKRRVDARKAKLREYLSVCSTPAGPHR